MTMPNFLIIGAAKAGTTALYHYLKEHPEIYMAPQKEPKFFALEGEKLNFRGPGDQNNINKSTITDIESYRELFQGASNQKVIGEASPLYLYSPKAPERIRHYIPDTKLIAILRDPVERAYSGYLMHISEGRETARDFAEALREEEMRIRNNWGWGHYASVGFYHSQLKRYFDNFNHHQIRVYLYEDLKTNSISLLQDIFNFLNVEESFVPDISIRHNITGIPKNTILQTLIQSLKPLNPVFKLVLPANLRQNIKTQILVKPQLPPEIRKQLIEVYREDILKLEELIQRDLSKWHRMMRVN